MDSIIINWPVYNAALSVIPVLILIIAQNVSRICFNIYLMENVFVKMDILCKIIYANNAFKLITVCLVIKINAFNVRLDLF